MKKICKFILLKIIQSCTRYYNTCYFQRKKWKKNCCGRKWAESGIKVVCSENRNCTDYSISLKVTWYFLGSICSSKFENSFIKKWKRFVGSSPELATEVHRSTLFCIFITSSVYWAVRRLVFDWLFSMSCGGNRMKFLCFATKRNFKESIPIF